jgi:uncharacterized membrane protein YkoI
MRGEIKMKNNLWWISLSILAIVLGGVVIYLLFTNEKPQIGETQLRQIIKEKYAGNVTQIKKDQDQYQVRFQNKFGIYQVNISIENAQVEKLAQLEQFPTTSKPKNGTKNPENKRLAEEKARQLAKNQVKGSEVKEIELEEEAGILQYEIVLVDANEREITVYINAYTGDILSIVTHENDDD